jgi:hypothetical protein
MVEFRIRGEKEEKEVLEFYLENCGGDITLKARDNDDFRWRILAISRDSGKLRLYGDIDTKGLSVDSHGRLEIEE